MDAKSQYYNDHKPLEMIQKSQYMQPHLIFKKCYLGFRSMTIILYKKPGMEMILADRLSRFPV